MKYRIEGDSLPAVIVELEAGESIICQKTAFLCATAGVNLSVFFQKKLGAGLVGGEGLFDTVITGPGKVCLQTMTAAKLAGCIAPYIPTKG